jgi:hypothetical protein
MADFQSGFVKNVLIPMRDGIHLALDMHVPGGEGPFPVILEYIPYRKDDVMPFAGHHHYFAQHGYIGARLDVRGTGASEGVNKDEYARIEQEDCCEAIAWLATRPWCDGNVAMFGASYGGFTCVQVAMHQPPHLRTIIPMYFTDDRYTDDCHYRGGCLRCYYDIGAYGASMIGMNAMPPYPEYSGADWARIWEQHLQNNEPYLLTWLQHQTDDEYWHPASLRGQYHKILCPVFMIGGWRDGYPNPPLRTFANLNVPKKVLVGSWNHSRPDVAIPGPRIDYLREVVRWCDHWLKGINNGVMDEPPICVYMQTYDEPKADRLETSGYWRVEREFPIAEMTEKVLVLSERSLTETVDGNSHGDVYDAYVYRPTIGTCGGLWSGGVPFGLPTDQRPDEVYSLNYTSEPLTEPLEIIGAPQVVLWVSSTSPVMAFVARLCDVAPDETSALVCSGALNATRRHSRVNPTPLTPHEVYDLTIDLDCTAWRFESGHRIRLSICSADFPNLWPTPYAGTNRVYRDPAHPSQLFLPVVPTKDVKNEIEFIPSNASVSVYRVSPNEPPWEIVHDVLGDRVGLKMHTRNTARANPNTDIAHEASLEVWASNRNPADVVATSKHHRRIVRADGVTAVDTHCCLRSADTAFHVTIDLDISVNELPHFQRRWVRSFPRALL